MSKGMKNKKGGANNVGVIGHGRLQIGGGNVFKGR
jgi:hypothetical protein